MHNFFTYLYRYFEKRRTLLLVPFGLLVIYLGYNVSQLKLEEDVSKMMPSGSKIRKINGTIKKIKNLDRLVVNIHLKDTTNGTDEAVLKEYAELFSSHLNDLDSESSLIEEITLQQNEDIFFELNNIYLKYLPIFLEENDYSLLEEKIKPENIDRAVENNFKALMSPSGMALKRNILSDPLGLAGSSLQRLQSLQISDNFVLDEGYIFTKNKQHLLCFIKPSHESLETSENKKLVKNIISAIEYADSKVDGEIAIEYFGSSVVAAGNAERIEKDVINTLSITLIALILLIVYFFKRVSSFFTIFVPVLFGVLFSLGMLYLLREQVSIIAIGAGSVVLGISVDFAIHFYTHFKHTNSIVRTIKDLTFPLTLGGSTTIGAFLSLLFVDSEALQDFGLFAAFCLTGTALFILVVYPHFLKESKGKDKFVLKENWISKISKYPFEKNKYLISFILILAVVSIYTSQNVEFESDMMKMNYMSEETAFAEKHLEEISDDSDFSVIYLVSQSSNLDSALEKTEESLPQLERLKKEGLIKEYTNVNTLLLSNNKQVERIEKWNSFWTEDRKRDVQKNLLSAGSKYKFKENSFEDFYTLLDRRIEPIGRELMDAGTDQVLDNYLLETPESISVITIIKAPIQHESEILAQFESNKNVEVFSKKHLTNWFVVSIKNNFNLILGISSILVFVFLLISYGRIELALITYIPMVLSWLIILGLMGMFGLKFNIINIIISTFIFGLGDDYSIFITDALTTEYKTGEKNLNNYKSSIFLSSITTIVGIGALIFAVHPALKSIGLIAVIGMFSVILVSNSIQPALFHFLITNRTNKKRVPYTLLSLIRSVFAFAYFGIGCFIMIFFGFIVLKLLPLPLSTRKKWFHQIRHWSAKSMIYVNVHVSKRRINPLKENFDEPAIIICNHHSVIDSLLMQSLSPKLILVVNDWVWNNTFMGPIVRLGGFIPKEAGYDSNLKQISELVKEGYSIAIFPEGTRSPSEELNRFHKGAFFLAEKLDLDIVPIIFHGTAFVQGREDNFLLKPGEITVKYLPRISQADESFGLSYGERTKKISNYFKQEYALLRAEKETVKYFYDRLRTNYIYKGPVLEWYMKIKVRMEGYYELFDKIVPQKGIITDIGCGYGFLLLMLGFRSNERKLIGIDYDDEKIKIANKCFSKTDNISFTNADVKKQQLTKSNAFILSDVLHYLPHFEQEKLIKKCIENLLPNGRILIRDGDKELVDRHKRTKLTEFFSTNFGFNKMEHNLEFLSGSLIEELAIRSGLQYERIDNTKYTSNVIYILRN